MNPMPIELGRSGRPEDFILPIRVAALTGTGDPEPVEWWQWVESKTVTQPGRWVRVVAVGGQS